MNTRRIGSKPLTCLSMGWGVQTWTLVAMMALGEHERPDLVVFADTHHEGRETYDFIRRQTPWLGEHGLDVVTVEGKRTDATRDDWNASVLIPAFTREDGIAQGQMQRQCTGDWKIVPIRRYIRAELSRRGIKKSRGCVESWQGISWDESYRMRDSDVQYIVNRYPLIDLRMTRKDCILWLENHGLPIAPKSACVFCPYSGIRVWKERKRKGGTDWNEAVATDVAIRSKRPGRKCYVHPSRIPLPEAVRIPEDEGAHQAEMDFCEGGYCHV